MAVAREDAVAVVVVENDEVLREAVGVWRGGAAKLDELRVAIAAPEVTEDLIEFFVLLDDVNHVLDRRRIPELQRHGLERSSARGGGAGLDAEDFGEVKTFLRRGCHHRELRGILRDGHFLQVAAKAEDIADEELVAEDAERTGKAARGDECKRGSRCGFIEMDQSDGVVPGIRGEERPSVGADCDAVGKAAAGHVGAGLGAQETDDFALGDADFADAVATRVHDV